MPRSSLRRGASALAFALGSVWGVAGAFKLLFGTQLTLPILPPLGLERVAAVPAMIVAIVCFGVAAWLGRSRHSSPATNPGLPRADKLLLDDANPAESAWTTRRRQDISQR